VSPVGDTFCVPCKYLVVPDGQEDPQTFTSRPAALSSESGERGKSDQNGHHRAPISRKTWWAQGSFGLATMSRVIRIAGRPAWAFQGLALRYCCPHSHALLLDIAPCCATASTCSHREDASTARVKTCPTTSRCRRAQRSTASATSSPTRAISAKAHHHQKCLCQSDLGA
jgi:hypothetical protein